MRDPKRILKRSFNFFHIFLEIIQGSCGKKIKKKNTTGKSVERVCQTRS